MSENWNPAMPDLARGFHDAERGAPDQGRRTHSTDPVTAGQLESLENARSAPALEEHLRIGGPCEAEVHRKLDTEREGEIRYVEDRLRSAADELIEDFDRVKHFERPRDFEKPRGFERACDKAPERAPGGRHEFRD